jgi:hypothetical protein
MIGHSLGLGTGALHQANVIIIFSTATSLLPPSAYQIWNKVSVPVRRYEPEPPARSKRPCQALAKIDEHAGESSKAGVLNTVVCMRVERGQRLGGLDLIWQLSEECGQRVQQFSASRRCRY